MAAATKQRPHTRALRLCLLRHGKSDWDIPGQGDRERRLSARGRSVAPRIGAWMLAQGLAPDLVLCSSAVRTRETLKLLPEALTASAEILIENDLYLAASTQLLERLHTVPEARRIVLVIGHNPGLHALALDLVGKGSREDIAALGRKLPTASLAVIDFQAAAWTEVHTGKGTLAVYMTPAMLGP